MSFLLRALTPVSQPPQLYMRCLHSLIAPALKKSHILRQPRDVGCMRRSDLCLLMVICIAEPIIMYSCSHRCDI